MNDTSSRHDPLSSHVPAEVLEHLEAARSEIRKGMETFLPDGFFEHRDAARREMLLAGRGAIDEAIRRMDAKRSPA
ncbi:hypothetical protein [Actinotalea sp.]|uniref:hypothetical protein n=1 Tax=Actinotalea sp. TaxID=1872145 RepID=UPI0035659188